MAAIQRNNLLAGTFLIASVTLTVVIASWLGGITSRIGKFETYTVRFPLASGAEGVEENSPVQLGGVNIGRVSGVSIVTDGPESGVAMSLEVEIKVPAKYTMYENASIAVNKPLFGALSAINISDVGGPRVNADGSMTEPARLTANSGPVQGSVSPGLLAQAGLGAEQVEQFRSILANTEGTVANIRALSEDLRPGQERNAATNVYETTEAIRAFAAKIRDEYEPRLDGIVTNIERGAEDVPNITAKVETRVDEAQALIEDGRGIIASGREAVDTARPKVQEFLDGMRSASRIINDETLPGINDGIERGGAAFDEFRELGERTNTLIMREDPQIARTVANLRLVSDQAAIFFEEVRAAPWRLLNRPGTKELEQEILYGAARSYARAVADLRAATERLDATLAGVGAGQLPAGGAEQIAALRNQLTEAYGEYETAEQSLLDLLSGDTRTRFGE